MNMNQLISTAFIIVISACISYKQSRENILSVNETSAQKNLVETKYVKVSREGNLVYIPDEKGNTIPDFSRVGFYGGDREIPDVPVVKTISATGTNNDLEVIQ